MVKTESLLHMIRNKARMSGLVGSTSPCTGGSSQGNSKRVLSKRHRDWKKEVKLSVLRDDMILCTENPKETTYTKNKLLEVTNELNKVANTNFIE